MTELEWFENYSGESVDQLLSLEGKYRADSLVIAFEQAVGQKAAREGDKSLSREEQYVLAIEGLEREVNNGGYSQFFINASEFVAIIVEALDAIACPKTAQVTRQAIEALKATNLNESENNSVMASDNAEVGERLDVCDSAYRGTEEDIAQLLLLFIRSYKHKFKL